MAVVFPTPSHAANGRLGRDVPLVVCGYRAPDDEQLTAWRAACPGARRHVVVGAPLTRTGATVRSGQSR